jgi:stage II sporulation protein D
VVDPRVRRVAVAATVLLAGVAVSVPPAGAAVAATETWPRPYSGSFELVGHGYGHGRGMSQWGAYGAATRGLDHRAVLDFYYPGTTHVTQAAAAIRVWLKADNDSETRVEVAAGLAAADGSVSRVLPTSDAVGAIRGWRVRRDGSGLYLQYLDATGTWRAWNLTSSGRSATPVTLTASGGLVRLVLPDGTRRDYRGGIRAVASGSSPGLRSVAVLPMDEYLRSVVPAEMPPSWPAEALRAQSVAARTYASHERRNMSASAAYDTCDDTACQVFRGTAAYRADGSLVARYEYAATDQAVAATANQVRHYGGVPAFTQFSAANGGWTVAGGRPYLTARADPYDGVVASTAHAWRVTVSAATLQQRWPAVGAVTALRVVERDGNGRWGGRTTRVTVTGTSGSVTVTGDQFRSALGLRSSWWAPINTARRQADWQGDGRGDLLARDLDGRLWLYPGAGGGRFASRVQVGTGWESMDAVQRADDFDGDGHVDVLARDAQGRLWLYPGSGGERFRPPRQVGWGWQGMTALVGVGSWDADGRADVLAVDGNGRLLLYPGNGAGGWLSHRQVGQGWDVMDVVVPAGDWDGDGRADILARDATGALWLYPGNGSGGFLGRRQVGWGWQTMSLLSGPGDVDGDGRPDVVAADAAGTLWLYRGNGTGGWLPRQAVGGGWTGMDVLP